MGGNFQKQGMVGSSKNFLGGDDEVEGNKKAEKLKIIKKAEKKNERDKAAVKYNFLDFLSQAHNLTD